AMLVIGLPSKSSASSRYSTNGAAPTGEAASMVRNSRCSKFTRENRAKRAGRADLTVRLFDAKRKRLVFIVYRLPVVSKVQMDAAQTSSLQISEPGDYPCQQSAPMLRLPRSRQDQANAHGSKPCC